MPSEKETDSQVSNILYQSGFTVVELMIGIAIVTILGTIAVPNILSEIPKFRLNGAAQQVLGDLMAARMRAASQNKKVKVVFTDGNQYQICDDPFDPPCWKDRKIQDNFKGISIDTGNNPIFHPRGTALPMKISIRNKHNCKDLIISIAGRIRIDSSSCL
jgi:type IV fimbrial biogenesis protein FimT